MSISVLVQQLAEVDTACEAADAISARACLAVCKGYPGTFAKIVAAGAIPPLVAMLGAQSTAAAQEKAAGTLWNLANDDDTRVKVIAAGAIPPLVG